MERNKIIASVAVGAAIALFLIPKTRRLITDAVSNLACSLKDMAGNVKDIAGNAEEISKKAKEVVVS